MPTYASKRTARLIHSNELYKWPNAIKTKVNGQFWEKVFTINNKQLSTTR